MLIAEYDYNTDIAVQRTEERKIAFAEDIEQGIQQGRSEGVQQSLYQKARKSARILKQLCCDTAMIA